MRRLLRVRLGAMDAAWLAIRDALLTQEGGDG